MSTAHLGLRLEQLHGVAGRFEVPSSSDHRVKVLVGAPVYGRCKSERFIYTPGDVDLFPAGDADHWEEEAASHSLMVSLSPSLVSRAANELGLRDTGLAKRHQFRDPQIEHIARALEAEQQSGGLGGTLFAEGLGLALAVHLLGRYRSEPRTQRGLTPLQKRRLSEYIEAHLDRDLRLTKLAELVGLRSTQFKLLFRASFGLPVHEYVVQRRVARAKQLLQEGRLPLSQVALTAGFSHQSHMARCMRRVLGVTPSIVRA